MRQSHYPLKGRYLMRTRFWKLAALMLALMLALTGCSLIEIDQEMDMAEVVATVGDTKITKGDVMDVYTYQVEYMDYLYSYYGLTMTEEDVEGIKDDVIEYYIELELLKQKATELGLTDFSDEFFAEADATAVEEFEGMIEEHKEHVSTSGLSEEAAREAVVQHLADEGTTLETIKKTYRDLEVADLVREYVISSVEVTDEEIQAAYEEKVAADQETYSGSSYLYETYQTYGETIAWNPEGYRTVKHILFQLTEEQTTALSELNAQLLDVEAGITALNTASDSTDSAEPAATADPAALPEKTIDELNAEKAELEQQIADKEAEILASFKEKTDAVYARLEAGEEFDALMAELGEDPGMQSEPSMSSGYYVSAASTVWDTNFRDAAMAIEAIGEVSEPILSGSGVHIIYYNSDVAPGAVDIEAVREVLVEEALTAKQDEAYVTQYEEWKKGVTIKKYPKVLG